MWPCERAAARRARAAEWFERSRSPRQAITCLPREAAGARARGDCDAGPHAYSSPVADRAIAFYGALLDARLVLDVRAAEIGTPGAHDVIPLEKADDAIVLPTHMGFRLIEPVPKEQLAAAVRAAEAPSSKAGSSSQARPMCFALALDVVVPPGSDTMCA